MFQQLIKIAEDSVRQVEVLQQAQTRLLQSLEPETQGPLPHAGLSLAPLNRIASYQQLLSRAFTRQLMNAQGLWALALEPQRQGAALEQAIGMQRAILTRLEEQQKQLTEGFGDLAGLVGSLKDANTLSKLLEQEYNVFARLGSLLNGQATSLLELMESVQIGFGYLLAREAQATAD